MNRVFKTKSEFVKQTKKQKHHVKRSRTLETSWCSEEALKGSFLENEDWLYEAKQNSRDQMEKDSCFFFFPITKELALYILRKIF